MSVPRYWIALCLASMSALAVVLAIAGSFWLVFAGVPPALGALACLAPRAWLSNDAYRRTLNLAAYMSIIPAAIALAAAVGFTLVAVLAVPALATFVFVMWRTRAPATQ